MKPPLWTTFADSDLKSFSFARIASTMMLIATITWGTWIVWKTTKIPDFTSVALIFGAIYGVPKIAESGVMNPGQPTQP